MAVTPPQSQASVQVQSELQTLKSDQQEIAQNKGNTAFLSANVDKYQADFKKFQQDSSGLQQSSSGTDIQDAQSFEAQAYDAFDSTQSDLKEALGSQDAQAGIASGDPALTHLQSGVSSLIDEGNANVLHLQQINNNVDQINHDTGIGIAPMLTGAGGTDDIPKNNQYGSGTLADGTSFGVVSGGTASPNDVAATADSVRQVSGQQDTGNRFGNT